MEPAEEVGGDYYDIINGEEVDWIIMGDVSGHGVPAGLIMMMVQASIGAVLKQNIKMKPSDLIKLLNLSIIPKIKKMRENKFMAINAILFHRDWTALMSGRHQIILIYRAEKDEIEYIQPTGEMISVLHSGSGSSD